MYVKIVPAGSRTVNVTPVGSVGIKEFGSPGIARIPKVSRTRNAVPFWNTPPLI
jgi:hypothetical protein